MTEEGPKGKRSKGEFEEFKSAWLLQVAADRGSKASAPVAMVLACKYLNRGSGKAWPGIDSLKEATGAASTNTIRSALKLLEERGHAHIEWSDGGKNKTHVVTPVVNGKPFKNLKGFEVAEPFNNPKGSNEANPSTFDPETLQVSDAKPFKKLNPNHLKEPPDLQGAAKAAPPEGKGSDNNIRGDGPLKGRPPTGDRDEYPAGEQTEVHPFDDEEIFAHDDDGEGIPFDGGPVCAASEQREAPHRDVLAQCLRRADELGEHERRLTHILAIRLREGHQFSEADRNALAAICRRLSIQFPVVDSHEDFADDLAAVRPDLSPPSARKTTEA